MIDPDGKDHAAVEEAIARCVCGAHHAVEDLVAHEVAEAENE